MASNRVIWFLIASMTLLNGIDRVLDGIELLINGPVVWRPVSYGTTELGYGTTPDGCRGGNRFGKGGFRNLTEKAID